MVKKLALVLAVLVLLAPVSILLGLAVLVSPAANASCTTSTGLAGVGPIPDSLTATTKDGQSITLSKTQLTHAATIITVGGNTPGVGRNGVLVALMAALTESSLRMLANTSTYPESANYPHDGNGSDHDSLGLFQERPAAGWGTVAQLMDPNYQTRAFFGGPTGPNHGSPRGLLDIPGWQQMDPGTAAQTVEVSAYPDRYQNYQPVAEKILTTLTTTATSTGAEAGGAGNGVPETSRVVFPLPTGTWVKTDGFGPRTDPITGAAAFHSGIDLAAPAGTPIYAAADGTVTFAGMDGDLGVITITHTISGQPVATKYLHMYPDGIGVHAGDTVTAGQQIGVVGSSGHSTGPHLHFEVHPGGPTGTAIDPEPWLTAHGATNLDTAAGTGDTSGGCGTSPTSPAGAPTPFTGPDGGAHVPDPTGTGGFVTKRTANLITQARQAFDQTGWACWSARPGSTSEHPLGRACDVTVGNQIGTRPTPAQLEVLIPGDAAWPTGVSDLRERAPFALWVKGDTGLLTAPVTGRITLTGARAATSYGEHVAMELAAAAVGDDRQVVSGGAYGIDGQAHRAALASGGSTIAVLAGGLDRLYPAGNQDLLRRIGQDGLLVSEIPPGEPPTRWRFQQRARLMAALSGAVVVVEAGYRSGALTTAARAVELGRRVGAVPGPVTSATSAGTHRLLAEGTGSIVTGYADIRTLLDADRNPQTPPTPSREEPQFGTRPAQRPQGTSGPVL